MIRLLLRAALLVFAGVSLAGPAFAATAQDAPAAPPLPDASAPLPIAPEERLRRLEERLQKDEDELVRLRQAGDNSVRLRVFDPSAGVRVQLQMLLQLDFVPYRQTAQDEINTSTGAPLNTQRFLVRRARPRISVESKYLGASLMLDGNTVNGPSLRVLEAETTARFPAAKEEDPPLVALGFGLFRTPFGFELQQPSRQRLFLERTNMARAMFGSSFDLGARVYGGYRFLRYSVAAMNGNPVGTGAFELQDPSKSKDLVFRAGIDVPLAGGRFEAGFSGLTGEGLHSATANTKDSFAWRDANGNGIVDPTELVAVPGAAATASQSFSRFALGADVRARFPIPGLGNLTLQAELIRGSNLDRTFYPSDPVVSGRNLRQFGWNVAAAQEITRYATLGIRYDAYDPDTDANELSPKGPVAAPRAFSTLAFVAAAIYTPGRLLVEYDVNRNPYGRDATGAPTTLNDDTLTIRTEVAF